MYIIINIMLQIQCSVSGILL